MSVTVERVDPMTQEDVLLPFLHEHVNKGLDRAGFLWQFEQMPGKAIFILGHEGGVPVCTQSFLPQTIVIAGSDKPSMKSEHSFLLPTQRGTPVFTDAYALGMKLSHEAGFGICWGFTPAVKVWRGKLGFQVFEDAVMECTSLLGRPRATNAGSLKGALRFVRDTLRYMAASLRGNPYRGTDRSAEEWPSMDEIHGLHRAVSGPGCVHLKMDEPFIRWRMLQNPNVDYRCFTVRSVDSELKGYAIIGQAKKNTAGVYHLCDAAALTDLDMDRMLVGIGMTFGAAGRSLRYFGNGYNTGCKRVIAALHRRFLTTSSVNPGMSFVLKESTATTPIEAWCLNALWTQGFHR